MNVDRTFTFRGNRDYLHSVSVFDDLLRLRGLDATRIDLKFHHRTARQVAYTDVPDATRRTVAEWTDANGRLYVVERDEDITERTPYDEPALARMLEVDGRSVHIPAETPGFTRIEGLVAGFKLLLQTVYADVDRKYVFVRVRLAYCPKGAMEIHYTRDIGAFFQGDILADSNNIGQIFFGVW